MLNSTDAIANTLTEFAFTDRELFNYIEEIAHAKKEEVEQRFKAQLNSKNSALSVVRAEV